MLPNNSLSSIAQDAPLIWGKEQTDNLLIDYELGGIGLNDASAGHMYQTWKAEVLNFRDVWFSAPNTPRTRVFSSGYAISQISISFDQLMHPYVAYVEQNTAKMFYYNSAIGANDVLVLPLTCRSPKITLDDKREFNISNSDVILAYMNGTNLCVRYQIDRFLIEYVLASNIDGDILKIGFNEKNRIQFQMGKRMTEDQLLKILASGSPIANSEIVISDPSNTPSSSDLWELERKP